MNRGAAGYGVRMNAIQHIVLSAVGADRTGLVDQVTAFVLDHGGNLEDSRMVNLRGQFAMMILVAGSEEVMGRLRDGLGALEHDAQIHAEIHAAGGREAAASLAVPYRLNTWAMDTPGLMRSVSRVLAEKGVNIESAETTLRPAPFTNTPLFEMELVVAVPSSVPVAELREAVGELCDELNIDWNLAAL